MPCRKYLPPTLTDAERLADVRLAEVRDLKVSADVSCERDAPARGTWHRHAGRIGHIAAVNVQTMERTKRIVVEFGVRFTLSGSEPVKWFRPSELQRVYGPVNAPRSVEQPPGRHR